MAKKSVKAKLLPEVTSLAGLRNRCDETNFDIKERYRQLAMIAAENLGASPKDYKEALEELDLQANVLDHEFDLADDTTDGEGTIVDEINFVRDIEAEEFMKRR